MLSVYTYFQQLSIEEVLSLSVNILSILRLRSFISHRFIVGLTISSCNINSTCIGLLHRLLWLVSRIYYSKSIIYKSYVPVHWVGVSSMILFTFTWAFAGLVTFPTNTTVSTVSSRMKKRKGRSTFIVTVSSCPPNLSVISATKT